MDGTLTRIVAVAAATLAMTATADAEQLRYSTFEPPNSSSTIEMERYFADIAEASGGSLTARIFPGGQLLGGPGTLKGVGDGVADGGFVPASFNQGELRNTNVVADMAFYVRDAFVAALASADTTLTDCPACLDEYATAKVAWLAGFAGDPWYLMCRDPIATTADLRGRKVRVQGGSPTRYVESFGGVAVQLRSTEIEPGLRAGQIDCAFASLSWMEDYQLYGTIGAVVDYPVGVFSGVGSYVFNSARFESLSEEHRKILVDAIPNSIVRGTQGYLDRVKVVREKAAQQNVSFWQPDEQFIALLETFRTDDMPRLIEDMKNRGATDPEKMIQTHLANIEKWRERVEAANGDLSGLLGTIADEIYANR